MRVSLIITTYEWPQALRLALSHIRRQSRLPDEVIIADDGSGAETAEVVRREAQSFPVPLVHSWQEDRGFRAARSRNLAIAKATGDYIVLLDGDMVPGKSFVADHRQAARPGFFIQGGRVLLPKELTERLLAGGDRPIHLLTPGLGNRKNMLRLVLLSRLLSTASRSHHSVRTCNFAFWRENAVAVNGFNEEFVGWGREDSEFAVRLLNSGLRRLTLRFAAPAFHLFHREESRLALLQNDHLLEEAVNQKKTRCIHGIRSQLPT